jgi:flagellar motor switch protein FliM
MNTTSKTLDQKEVDELLGASQSQRSKLGGSATKKVVPCDVRLASRLTSDEVAAVSALHESFARRLSSSLAAHLRVAFDMHLASVEQLTYHKFTVRAPDLTYFASLHVMPIDARSAIQCDLALAYAMIDLVLGGSGTETIEVRDLTEIEEQILETVIRLIVHDLRNSWAAFLELDIQFEQRQQGAQVQNMMVADDKVLCLTFEAGLSTQSGSLAVIIPAVVANALLRRLCAQSSLSKRIPSRESRRRFQERLLDSRFKADLSLPASLLPIRQLIDLKPGPVLMLAKGAREPIHLNIAGKPMFLAYPVRQGSRRSARVEKRASILSTDAIEKR